MSSKLGFWQFTGTVTGILVAFYSMYGFYTFINPTSFYGSVFLMLFLIPWGLSVLYLIAHSYFEHDSNENHEWFEGRAKKFSL
jgi:hypothetical protein